MLKIRLMRIGGKGRPFYRVVLVDERSKRTGGYLELLGTYNPLTDPKEIKINQERIEYWVKKGAKPSDGYLRITGKAPQRPPRKPKKESKQVPPDSKQVKEEEPKAEKIQASEAAPQAPTEETAAPQAEHAQAKKEPKGDIPQAAEEPPKAEAPEGGKTSEGSS